MQKPGSKNVPWVGYARRWLGVSCLGLAACASAPAPRDGSPADALADALAGQWSNAAQYAAAPAALKVPASVDRDWMDLQHAAFHRVDAPLLGDTVLYLEWRTGAADGPVSRQRIWRFTTATDGSVQMAFHAFVDAAPYAGRGDTAGAFTALDLAALRVYPEPCALRFVRDGSSWQGAVSAAQCRITAASGRQMGINAQVELRADGSVLYQESGELADGRFAFRVPPTEPYRFVPAAPATD